MTIDFAAARRNMVDGQIRTADVTNPDVVGAFLDVPREAFLPDTLRPFAYVDDDLRIAFGRYLAAPATLARLIQASAPRAADVVLLVGAGTGYCAALLSRLCAQVLALESDGALAAAATGNLSDCSCSNVVVVEGPLASGLAGEGPYDLVFIEGAIGRLPESFTAQVKEGGRLIAVEGTGNSAMARLHVREAGRLSARPLFNCAMKPLPGFEKAAGFIF